MSTNRFPALLQGFFLNRLMTQRNASPATVRAYRDTFRLLLRYLEQTHHGMRASDVTVDMLTADTILAFLTDLEVTRHNSIKTRNHRLAAIHSFMDYVGFEAPEYLAIIQRVKQIPFKKAQSRVVSYLLPEEMEALLAVCAVETWLGRRDRLMLALLYNTGIRVSELVSLAYDSVLQTPSGVQTLRIWGKGRKERVLPLWRNTQEYVADWMRERGGAGQDELFSNCRGEGLTRSGVTARLK
ncbi:MAG: tyrosine-type recombinase/integrase, partial [Thermaerobacter sp.]|nr:tyrosine-type recombinase/integrase [Thermaerobacter sp.]